MAKKVLVTKKELVSGLPEEVAAKFKLRPGYAIGKYVHNMTNVNLATITLKEAEDLVRSGFEPLELISEKKFTGFGKHK